MYRLEFTHARDYSGDGESVVLPVVLRSGASEVELSAHVDTGASYCLFGSEIADKLGLTAEYGLPMRFRTANSSFEAFGHDVEIDVLGVAVTSMVFFFADPAIEKNVLGRTGWLDRVRFGLVHQDSTAYFAPYDDV